MPHRDDPLNVETIAESAAGRRVLLDRPVHRLLEERHGHALLWRRRSARRLIGSRTSRLRLFATASAPWSTLPRSRIALRPHFQFNWTHGTTCNHQVSVRRKLGQE